MMTEPLDFFYSGLYFESVFEWELEATCTWFELLGEQRASDEQTRAHWNNFLTMQEPDKTPSVAGLILGHSRILVEPFKSFCISDIFSK